MHPTLFPFETKFRVSDEAGTFTGFASTFGGEPDSYGDVILPGAFAKSLAQHQVRKTMPSLLWAHSMGEPIGVWTEMRETSAGLEVKGRLTMDVERAREAHALMKDGALSLSIGFMLPEGGAYTDRNGVRHLREIDLMEVSAVSIPANRNARITQVKAGAWNTPQEFERTVRDVLGLSARQAKRLCADGFSAMVRDEPDRPEELDAEKLRAIATQLRSITQTLRNAR